MLYHCRMWCYAISVEAVVLRSWCVILCTVCQLVYILYYIAFLLAPWSRVLLEKLTGSQLVKKFPHFMEPKFHYSIHKCLPPVPILSPYQWINPDLKHEFIFHNMTFFMVRSCSHLTQPLSWGTTPCGQSATAYSMYSQLPCILEAVPPSAT